MAPQRARVWRRVVRSVPGAASVLSLLGVVLAVAAAVGWIDACGLSFGPADIGVSACKPDERALSVVVPIMGAVSVATLWKTYERIAREESQAPAFPMSIMGRTR